MKLVHTVFAKVVSFVDPAKFGALGAMSVQRVENAASTVSTAQRQKRVDPSGKPHFLSLTASVSRP